VFPGHGPWGIITLVRDRSDGDWRAKLDDVALDRCAVGRHEMIDADRHAVRDVDAEIQIVNEVHDQREASHKHHQPKRLRAPSQWWDCQRAARDRAHVRYSGRPARSAGE
jgi:hypothetical protein